MDKNKTGEEEVEQVEIEQEIEEVETEDVEDKPFWLQEEEDPDSEEEEDKGAVPVAKHSFVKKKLKGQISEKDNEISELRKELEQLKQGIQPKPNIEPPKRPRRAEFDDDDAYEDAMDKYEADKVNYQTQYVQQSSQQNQRIAQRKQQIEKAVDDHYNRADAMVEKHGIKPEIYQQADATVKGIIQTVRPDLNVEQVFSEMVDVIGDGSEITMFHVGRNKQAANEFARLLQEDPRGLKATLYLGRIAERVSGAKTNRSSQAPPPAAKLKGDTATSVSGQAAQKKYAEAHAKGKTQEAYNIKKAARAQGIDVSNWK